MAANGFRYRIPTSTLLVVSDKPLQPAPSSAARRRSFYAATRRWHVEIAIAVAERVRQQYPGGLPTADIRSPDEPLLGTTDPGPGPDTRASHGRQAGELDRAGRAAGAAAAGVPLSLMLMFTDVRLARTGRPPMAARSRNGGKLAAGASR